MMPGPGGLRRVVYVSRPTVEADDRRAVMLADILAAARRNNAARGVTGALLYGARRFAQVLEGPAEAVEAIFETIQCDPRHDDIVVLDVSSPDQRAFGGWSMAFAEAPEATAADFDAPDASDAANRLIGLLQAAIRNTEAAAAA